uniref:Uncharacterized protein n=1 Tax=Rhizophora mucronata TaxID=61149 RepID=A0A2P2NCQ8_RHIMU
MIKAFHCHPFTHSFPQPRPINVHSNPEITFTQGIK